MGATYDDIGAGYEEGRHPDPRIRQPIMDAIGTSTRVLDVGTGTGNYSPTDRPCVGVDPSALMLAQRDRANRGPSVQSTAEALPFTPSSFDCAVGVLTAHHWHDLQAGLEEMRRTSGRQVLFIREPFGSVDDFWLLEYFPTIMEVEAQRHYPTVADLGRTLDITAVHDVPVPADCVDGFLGCYWNRPEAFLDPAVRQCISIFSFISDADELVGANRLRADLASGRWDAHHGALRSRPEYFVGHRLVMAA